jgi:hypothetical protein
MRAHRTRTKVVVAAKAGEVSLLKKEISALKQANTKKEKKLKEAEEEVARLKSRERSGIPWRNPENAMKMFVSVGKGASRQATLQCSEPGRLGVGAWRFSPGSTWVSGHADGAASSCNGDGCRIRVIGAPLPVSSFVEQVAL